MLIVTYSLPYYDYFWKLHPKSQNSKGATSESHIKIYHKNSKNWDIPIKYLSCLKMEQFGFTMQQCNQKMPSKVKANISSNSSLTKVCTVSRDHLS